MKRAAIFLTIAILTAPVAILASALHLSMHDGAPFHVEFDKQLHPSPTISLAFDDIAGGDHYLVVFRHESRPHGTVIRRVFSGVIRVPEGMRVYGEIDHRSRYRVIHQQAILPAAPGMYVLSPSKLERVRRRMAGTLDDNRRWRIARRAINNHYITTMQAGTLISMLSFEDNRVRLARYAYPRVADKGNFRTLYTLFYDSSSIRKIERTIRHYHR